MYPVNDPRNQLVRHQLLFSSKLNLGYARYSSASLENNTAIQSRQRNIYIRGEYYRRPVFVVTGGNVILRSASSVHCGGGEREERSSGGERVGEQSESVFASEECLKTGTWRPCSGCGRGRQRQPRLVCIRRRSRTAASPLVLHHVRTHL